MFDVAISSINSFGVRILSEPVWLGVVAVAWTLIKIVAVVIPLMLCVAYLTLWERKAIGWMQVRIGPNRVGPLGLLQPIADGIKLLMKEIIVPQAANRWLFVGASHDHHAGYGRVGSHSVWARRGACQHQCGFTVPAGHHLAGGVWRHHRGLGF
jgi:hypothetical protein